MSYQGACCSYRAGTRSILGVPARMSVRIYPSFAGALLTPLITPLANFCFFLIVRALDHRSGTLRRIWVDDGFRGFYRGLGPTIFGYLPTWAIYFTVYDSSKAVLARDLSESRIGGAVAAVIVGDPLNPARVDRNGRLGPSGAPRSSARMSAFRLRDVYRLYLWRAAQRCEGGDCLHAGVHCENRASGEVRPCAALVTSACSPH